MQELDYFNIVLIVILLALGGVVFVAVSMFLSHVFGFFDYDE